jgi:outer membrane lipoprotein LolB
VARIVRDAEGMMLEMPNQPLRRAPDAESLTREALGYSLPVSGLTWWVQARPDPGRAFEATRDAAGRLAQLKQDGWVIDYLDYAADAPARPRKMVVAREGLEIRLVADDWQAE